MREYIIAIIPTDDVAVRAITVSHALRKHGGLYVLNTRSERPHVSLYHITFPPGAIHRAMGRLAKIAGRTASTKLITRALRQVDEWIMVEYQRSRALVALQHAVIAAMNPFRGGYLRDKDRVRLQTADPMVRRNILRCGYRSVGTLFQPHLTLTRLRDQRRVRLPLQGHRVAQFSCTPTAVGLYTSGAHGTCVHLLKRFPFRTL